MIYSFKNDYSSIAHPLVLKKLLECQNEQNVGYGLDQHSIQAKKYIQEKINHNSSIHFLVGGTQANMVVISSILRPYEAVICCESGHINVHETGAIEGQGHKCLTVLGENGKVRVCDILEVLDKHPDCHMVRPKMVYISNATEIGTVYSKKELKALYDCCKANDLYLFLDGARLASAMAASDVTYEDLACYTDIFYIGGTKNGGYIGEAVVINNLALAKEFDYCIKHFGAMLAKGFVAAIPFEVLMTDNLYLEIGKKENECAAYLTNQLKKQGVHFMCESSTNQIFPILSKSMVDYLAKEFLFEIWDYKNDNEIVIRLVTSFTTELSHCNKFLDYFKQKSGNISTENIFFE